MKHLQVDTIKSLRLSGRKLRTKCTGRYFEKFKKFINYQTIELTKSALSVTSRVRKLSGYSGGNSQRANPYAFPGR
ncbi:uncharacterized protein N7482_008354 [Penicillium canariense]|uniref:Uncharacterized protein n=1 Tax=Penicillium canariense TaxID=189055 RepID=A0A9W9HVL2_9EURO|nr:uncharacterized protein N7482_008354 [Penicillium canariense]KAJ5157254.1 hypothetical protein N7482_008354 [Penicillium canariense]